MEYPFGHHNHHHHNRRDDDDSAGGDGGYPRPPFSQYPPPSHQPSYGGGGGPFAHPPPSDDFPPPPPPPFVGAYHQPRPSDDFPPPPPPPPFVGSFHQSPPSDNYPPPPFGGSSFHHHQQPPPAEDYSSPPPPPQVEGGSYHFHPHMPSFLAGHYHQSPSEDSDVSHGGGPKSNPDDILGNLANKPTYRIYCKAGGDRYVVGIRDDKVVMVHSDSSDPTQHWIKDESFSTKVKDEEGYPSFALVNKGTGQVLKHSIAGEPVQLVPYQPNVFDGSTLWTESKSLHDGYRTIRMVNNVKLSLDAFHGDKDHGGVREGTVLALYECWKGDNQLWKIR